MAPCYHIAPDLGTFAALLDVECTAGRSSLLATFCSHMLFAAHLSGLAPLISDNTCGTRLLTGRCHSGCNCSKPGAHSSLHQKWTCLTPMCHPILHCTEQQPAAQVRPHGTQGSEAAQVRPHGTQGSEAGRSTLCQVLSMAASWQGDRPLINHAVKLVMAAHPDMGVSHTGCSQTGQEYVELPHSGTKDTQAPACLRLYSWVNPTPATPPCAAESSNVMYSSGDLDTQAKILAAQSPPPHK